MSGEKTSFRIIEKPEIKLEDTVVNKITFPDGQKCVAAIHPEDLLAVGEYNLADHGVRYSEEEKRNFIDLYNNIESLVEAEQDKVILTNDELQLLRNVVVPSEHPLQYAILRSVPNLEQCPCPECERRFESTVEERKSHKCKDKGRVDLQQVKDFPNLSQIHIHCYNCTPEYD
jgi:hypothetical protein